MVAAGRSKTDDPRGYEPRELTNCSTPHEEGPDRAGFKRGSDMVNHLGFEPRIPD